MNEILKTAVGILIPFLGTVFGSCFVFFLKGDVKPGVQKLLLGFASALVAAGFLIYHLFFRRHKPEELYVNRVRAAKEAARAEHKEKEKEEDEHGGDGH